MYSILQLINDCWVTGGGIKSIPVFHTQQASAPKKHRCSVILIPGLLSNWWDMYSVGKYLEASHYQIIYLRELGWNTMPIPTAAKLVDDTISDLDSREIILVCHSKGGLIGKYVLSSSPSGRKVQKMIAIATPFKGVSVAKHIPIPFIREVSRESEIIKNLESRIDVNSKICSIAARLDTNVGDPKNCYLEGAENIVLPIVGHHRILYNRQTLQLIESKIKSF